MVTSNINHSATPISGNLFTWEGKRGVAEISDLGPEFRHHQVYKDAVDAGFTVVSTRTGEQRTFVQVGEENRTSGEESEVLSWSYASINAKTGRLDREEEQLTITLFND